MTPPILAPEPMLKLLRAARLPPTRLLRVLQEETEVRGRLSTAGRPDLIARLPGLDTVNLTLRDGVVGGWVKLGRRDRLEFGPTDAFVHAGTLPQCVTMELPGRPIGDIVDAPALRGARYLVIGVRERSSPPEVELLFRAPRVPLLRRTRSAHDP